MPPKKQIDGDAEPFDAKGLTDATRQHGETIAELSQRVTSLEDKFSTPEQVADLLQTTFQDSKKLDRFFGETFVSMLRDEKSNPGVKSTILAMLDGHDRDQFFATAKKWSGFIFSASLFLGGYILQILVEWIKKKLGIG